MKAVVRVSGKVWIKVGVYAGKLTVKLRIEQVKCFFNCNRFDRKSTQKMSKYKEIFYSLWPSLDRRNTQMISKCAELSCSLWQSLHRRTQKIPKWTKILYSLWQSLDRRSTQKLSKWTEILYSLWPTVLGLNILPYQESYSIFEWESVYTPHRSFLSTSLAIFQLLSPLHYS